MSDGAEFDAEDMESKITRITTRIRQVNLAKNLAEKGNYQEALQLLANVRDKYSEERNRSMVDYMIRDYTAKAKGS